MDLMRGTVVRSLAGRDRGKLFCVLDEAGDFLALADGKCRGVGAPKRKRCKHAVAVDAGPHPVIDRIRTGEPVLDRELRRALAALRDGLRGDQGGNTLGKERYD